ncbi:MFS transporter [Roseomonas elaeocarpi]|uniref:MFS transporter n=1 Tax=Roseomonas elaeocarpi TaxID=907779 RepID=A0ABV6JMN9_9PROT
MPMSKSADLAVMEKPAAPAAPVVATSTLQWVILGLLALGALVSFVDRTSISAALTVPSFKAHFQLSDIDRGWVNSAFFWSYAVLQVPLGWATDRYGVKRPYTVCFFVWCVATALTGLTTTLSALIVMRLIVGAAEAIVVPASWAWIRRNFREDQSGTAVGIYMLGTKVGPAIGAPVAAWLIVAFDWRAMFVLLGIVGLLWLIPWNLLVKNDLPKRVEPGRVEPGRVEPGRAEKAAAAPPMASGKQVRVILASPMVWGSMVTNFCYNYFTFYCMTWMPSYLVEQRGLPLQQMGLYSFFSFIGIAIVALAAGWVADRLIERGYDPILVRKVFTIAGFLFASTVVLGAFADTVNEALFWNVASLSGLGLTTANHLALCRLTLIPKSIVGLVTGFQQVATALAGIVAPILSGWLLQVSGSYNLPMQVIFVFLIIGAFTTALVLRPQWAPRVVETEA